VFECNVVFILLRSSCCSVVVRWRLCSGAFCLCCGGGYVHCDLPMPTQMSTRGHPPPPLSLPREGLSLSMPHYLPWTAPCMFAKSVTDEWMGLMHWNFRVFSCLYVPISLVKVWACALPLN
jgi:hypothetical protein